MKPSERLREAHGKLAEGMDADDILGLVDPWWSMAREYLCDAMFTEDLYDEPVPLALAQEWLDKAIALAEADETEYQGKQAAR